MYESQDSLLDKSTLYSMGVVFNCPISRINEGKYLNKEKNIVEVGFANKITGENRSYDPKRITSQYVVEYTMDVEDPNPTVYTYDKELKRVFARRLNADGSYDPNGELIIFHNSYKFDSFLSGHIAVITKIMRRIITFVDDGNDSNLPELQNNIHLNDNQ